MQRLACPVQLGGRPMNRFFIRDRIAPGMPAYCGRFTPGATVPMEKLMVRGPAPEALPRPLSAAIFLRQARPWPWHMPIASNIGHPAHHQAMACYWASIANLASAGRQLRFGGIARRMCCMASACGIKNRKAATCYLHPPAGIHQTLVTTRRTRTGP